MDYEKARSDSDAMLTDVIRSLQQVQVAPGIKSVSLKGVQKEVANASASRDAAVSVIDTETKNLAMLNEQKKRGIDASSAAAQDKATADQDKAQILADQNRYIADMFGLTLDSSSDVAVLATKLRKELRPSAEEKLREVQEMQSVGMLDNPIEWLYNQVQLPSRINNYNREADAVNMIQNTIDTSINTASNLAQFSEKGVPAITRAQAKATIDQELAKAELLKTAADEDLAKVNVDFASKKLAKDLAITNATVQTTQLELQQAQQQFQASMASIQVANNNIDRKLKVVELTEKLQKLHSMDAALDQYDRAMGHPKGTTTRQAFDKLPRAMQENAIGISAGSAGAGPATALDNFRKARPGPEISPETLNVARFLQDELAKLPPDPMMKSLPKEQQDEIMDKKLMERVKGELVMSYKQGSLFYEMAPAKMIASGIVLPESRLGKALAELSKTNNTVPTTFVIETIMKEWTNPTEAGQVVAEYYKKNMELRNKVMNSQLFGIQLGGSYVVPFGRASNDKYKFDLTDPAQATKWIITEQAARRAQQYNMVTGM